MSREKLRKSEGARYSHPCPSKPAKEPALSEVEGMGTLRIRCGSKGGPPARFRAALASRRCFTPVSMDNFGRPGYEMSKGLTTCPAENRLLRCRCE